MLYWSRCTALLQSSTCRAFRRQWLAALSSSALLIAFLITPPLAAQTCWSYVNTNTLTPIQCVQQGNPALACSWGEPGPNGNRQEDCHEDGNLDDCCISIPAAGPQTVREMHAIWHDCFGAVGDVIDGSSPPNRGNRWYSFHRQIEHDYNLWREAGNFCNPTAGMPQGCKIESFQWCPGMQLTYGWDCDAANAGGCGNEDPVVDNSSEDCDPTLGSTNPCRPANAACPNCGTFPECLYRGGGGPALCPNAPSATCEGGGAMGNLISFPAYNELEDFQNIEEITTLLDVQFHGAMHGAVGDAGPCKDVLNSNCSVRDPMFWRLHKAIDDVVREWQNANASDVMLVVDRSGSMNQQDSTGVSKLEAALEAADIFADLLDHARPDGQVNRLGVTSYSSNANDANRNLSPINVDANLRSPGQPFPNVLTQIESGGGGGCTSIGAGIETALGEMCPAGDCSAVTANPPPGVNRRKGILLLTDGMENVAPCLQPATGAPSPGCGSQCFGAALDRSKMYDTQVCAVGFGNAGSLNGDLLTVFAEAQGGLYMQNPAADPDGEWIDLKDFYTKCFGQLTDEFLGLDPKGIMAAADPVSDPFEYTTCFDQVTTFVSGWKTPVKKEEVRLLVTSPAGDLVMASDPAVHRSHAPTWDYSRIRLPYRGQASGTWKARLVRPHAQFVNGFTSDSFADFEAGLSLVRDQIHRLCPEGCERVLYYEDETLGDSAYRKALSVEEGVGLLGDIQATDSSEELKELLQKPWDLIVYAHQSGGGELPHDEALAAKLCRNQRAIVTETRLDAAPDIFECAGAFPDGSKDHRLLVATSAFDGRKLKMFNPGHPIATFGLKPVGGTSQASFQSAGSGIVTRAATGQEQKWFANVLVRGLARLEAHKPVSHVKTGDDLLPTVRIAPLSNVRGGYDRVDARVEITRPLSGIGTLIGRGRLRKARKIGGELLDPRAATLLALQEEGGGQLIPTVTEVYPLRDDGKGGDLVADNLYWSAQLPKLADVDGMYQYRFIVELEKNSCTTRRELLQSVFVEVRVDPEASDIRADPGAVTDAGQTYSVSLTPRDRLGNLWGPGRPGSLVCDAKAGCHCDGKVNDHGDGSYSFQVALRKGAGSCTIGGFGTNFHLPLGKEQSVCLGLLEEIEKARIRSPQLRSRLLVNTRQACTRLLRTQSGAEPLLAEVLHELEAHAAEDLSPSQAESLKKSIEALAKKGGLAPEKLRHQH